MKGETALRIITATAFVFIFVFMLAAGGVGGDAETEPPTAAETPTVTPTPEMVTVPVPETTAEPTVAIVATPEPTATSADPVEGLWVSRGSTAERLQLNAGGTGEITTNTGTIASVREVAWEYDPAIRIGHLRAYHLNVSDEGEYILYLDEEAGTLKKNGQVVVLTYAPAP